MNSAGKIGGEQLEYSETWSRDKESIANAGGRNPAFNRLIRLGISAYALKRAPYIGACFPGHVEWRNVPKTNVDVYHLCSVGAIAGCGGTQGRYWRRFI